MIAAGSKVRKLLNHGVSACFCSSGGTPSQPVPLTAAAWICFCSAMRVSLSAGDRFMRSSSWRCCSRISSAPVVPLAATSTTRVDLLLPRRRQHRDVAALAVADHRDLPRIDVVATFQPFDDADEVVGELPLRRRLGAAAALSDAALVVAEDEIALLGERAGELAEDRDTGDGAVAIDRP